MPLRRHLKAVTAIVPSSNTTTTTTTMTTTTTTTTTTNNRKRKKSMKNKEKQVILRYVKVRWPVKITGEKWENWVYAATTTSIKEENSWKVTFKNNSKVYSIKKNYIWDITKQEYDEFNIEGKEEDVSYMAHETDKKKIEELQKTWHHENTITENALQVLHGINKAFNHGSINTEWTVTNVCIN